jgi:hypothetical protein
LVTVSLRAYGLWRRKGGRVKLGQQGLAPRAAAMMLQQQKLSIKLFHTRDKDKIECP